MFKTWVTLVLLATAPAVVSCSTSEKLDPSLDRLGRASGPVNPAAHPQMAGTMGSSSDGSGSGRVHAGRVAEAIQVPNYTYIRLFLEDGSELWTAVPTSEVSEGQGVRIVESLVMKDFASRTLSRTFESIVFGVLEGQGAAPEHGAAPDRTKELPPGHPPIDPDLPEAT